MQTGRFNKAACSYYKRAFIFAKKGRYFYAAKHHFISRQGKMGQFPIQRELLRIRQKKITH
jgi:hypothetical protein